MKDSCSHCLSSNIEISDGSEIPHGFYQCNDCGEIWINEYSVDYEDTDKDFYDHADHDDLQST